ncbi:MAG: hypothetical protein IJ615_05735 [Bacteroidaceae bacterium]|nr:hypothetical protein [Bacteroidaceae bacterium]
MKAVRGQTAGGVCRSASCLFRKRLVLISEAPRAYFRSASRLFPKRPALILEARAVFGGAARGFRKNIQLRIKKLPSEALPFNFFSYLCSRKRQKQSYSVTNMDDYHADNNDS